MLKQKSIRYLNKLGWILIERNYLSIKCPFCKKMSGTILVKYPQQFHWSCDECIKKIIPLKKL